MTTGTTNDQDNFRDPGLRHVYSQHISQGQPKFQGGWVIVLGFPDGSRLTDDVANAIAASLERVSIQDRKTC